MEPMRFASHRLHYVLLCDAKMDTMAISTDLNFGSSPIIQKIAYRFLSP